MQFEFPEGNILNEKIAIPSFLANSPVPLIVPDCYGKGHQNVTYIIGPISNSIDSRRRCLVFSRVNTWRDSTNLVQARQQHLAGQYKSCSALSTPGRDSTNLVQPRQQHLAGQYKSCSALSTHGRDSTNLVQT